MRGRETCAQLRTCAQHGFTLVELMVVMVIISILGSVIMFAMFNAQEAAREAKTKNIISKLNGLIMARYESYINRRVPLRLAGNSFARLQALREMMRLEMPDRWTDVFDQPVTGIAVPAVTRTYRRIVGQKYSTPTTQDKDVFQGAESLYLIVAHGLEDADALTHFSQSDIGDVDGDGLPEFLDGWGRPISWLRWPAGFESPRQSRNESKDFDQFNPYVVTPDIPQSAIRNSVRRYALFPLIYSGGADKRYDLVIGGKDDAPLHYSVKATNTTPAYVDPYVYLKESGTKDPFQVGQPFDQDGDGSLDHGDNIHNHNMTIR